MSQMSESNLTGHNYDGIEEYDNPTPGWWTWIFLGTIGFSVVYFLVMTLAMGELGPEAFYKRDYVESLKAQYGQLGNVEPDSATLARLMGDDKWRGVGQSIYVTNCASCHGGDGSGLTAPNLTDDFYLHVRKIEDIANVVEVGRKNGAMPAWGNRLQKVEQVLVSAYVASLRGKNLTSSRGVEGEKIEAWAK